MKHIYIKPQMTEVTLCRHLPLLSGSDVLFEDAVLGVTVVSDDESYAPEEAL